jgi:hypothetical protein
MRRLLWFSLLGPPLAWVVQFVLGFGVTQAACDPGSLNPSVNAWTIVLTAAATIVTVLGGLAAVRVFRATRDEELDGAPPGGRVYFMSIVALTTTPLFLFIIVMSGVGVIVLDKCHQS